MKIITYQIETEVDATWITSQFEERGIPYTIKKNSDLFPYNGERRPFAEILVLREFEKEAQAIFDENGKTMHTESRSENPDAGNKADQRNTRKRRLWQRILIIYSLAVTILLINIGI